MAYTEEEHQILQKFNKILSKNKIMLMREPAWAFFTAICFSLRLKIRFDIPTAATDGLNLYFNPRWMMKHKPAEQLGVLIHEVLHVAYMHVARMKGLIHGIANQAADHVINLQILAKGFELPESRLADERFMGISMEQVYKILLQEQKSDPDKGAGKLAAGGMGDDLLPLPPGENAASIEKKVEQILVQATLRAKAEKAPPGSIPGDLERMVNSMLNSKLPWQRLLQRYIKAQAKDDYSWRRPNRRYFPELTMPSLYSEKLEDLVVAVDTSGSVSDEEFSYMVSEIASIFKMMKPNCITLLQYDTRIHTITKIKSLMELRKCQFRGRGGTSVGPVMEWAEQHKPQVLLNFTDGCFQNPGRYSRQTEQRTLWLIHNNEHFHQPFGKTVHYEIRQTT